MNKIDKYIIKSFLGPFLISFVIALVIFLMIFLWKYIEDLVGKGLEWYIIAKLLFYASANMVPLSLPIAVLLACIIWRNVYLRNEATKKEKGPGMEIPGPCDNQN